jgi:hypothetical protein
MLSAPRHPPKASGRFDRIALTAKDSSRDVAQVTGNVLQRKSHTAV